MKRRNRRSGSILTGSKIIGSKLAGSNYWPAAATGSLRAQSSVPAAPRGGRGRKVIEVTNA
jgi:hypothetical protein